MKLAIKQIFWKLFSKTNSENKYFCELALPFFSVIYFFYLHCLTSEVSHACVRKEIWMNSWVASREITIIMAKRSQRRPIRYEKDHMGCMWAFISIFDFRHGRSTRKLLTDRRRPGRQVVGKKLFNTSVCAIYLIVLQFFDKPKTLNC